MPTPASIYIVDNLLTKIATGYKNDKMVGNILFPDVTVNKREGKYLRFNKEMMIDHSASSFIGRNSIPSAIDFEFSTATYALKDHALAANISTIEKEEQVPDGILNLRQRKNMLLTEGISVIKEREIASLVQTNTNYAVSNLNTLDNSGVGKYKWSHASADPIANLITAKAAIRADIGRDPDSIVFGYDSAVQMAKVTSVQQLVNPSAASSVPITPEIAVRKVAEFLGIPNYGIGSSLYTTSATGTLTNIWSDNVIMSHSGNVASQDVNSFGAMLMLAKYPMVFREEVQLTNGMERLTIRACFDAHPINWDAGYLIEDTV